VRPLEVLRIIAVEQYGAGPFELLPVADIGAEIIKIEDHVLAATSHSIAALGPVVPHDSERHRPAK